MQNTKKRSMSKQTIDNELLSKEREDIFDEYYNLIESFKMSILKAGISKEIQPNYDIIERALTILERNLDDLAKFELKEPNIVRLGNTSIQQMLKEWSEIFRGLGTRKEFVLDFSYNILIASALLSNIKKIVPLKFRKYIKYLSPRRMDRLNYEGLDNNRFRKYSSSPIAVYHIDDKKGLKFSTKKIPKDLINLDILTESIKIRRNQNHYKSILFEQIIDLEIEDFRNRINSNRIISEIEKERELPRNTSFEWTLEMKFNNLNDDYSSTQIGYTIWSISAALEQIDGVQIKLEDWGIGSRWARIKLQIRDFLAKEEVKEVLDKSKNAIEAKYVDTPIEEVKKIKAEREKLEKETESLTNATDAERLRQLNIEKLELENKATEIKIMQERINVIRGISELVTDGIIQNDSKIQILVNDMLYLEKDNEGVLLGENIEIIEEDQVIKKKEKDTES